MTPVRSSRAAMELRDVMEFRTAGRLRADRAASARGCAASA
ncbi:hypothetical protein AB0L71_07790 [Streptomyces sp. NPDC052052]